MKTAFSSDVLRTQTLVNGMDMERADEDTDCFAIKMGKIF